MPKTLSAKYYQKNKENLQQKARKRYLNNKKKKSDNVVVKVTKISQKMKNRNLFRIEKNIIEQEKTLYSYKKVF